MYNYTVTHSKRKYRNSLKNINNDFKCKNTRKVYITIWHALILPRWLSTYKFHFT